MLRRRREGKTDYRARLALVKSKQPRIVVRRSLSKIHIQIIKYEVNGDNTVTEVTSKTLKKYNWPYHGGSIPSAYLTGFLSGKIALKKGIKEVFLDIGLQTSTKGSSLFVAALGAKDAGLKLPLGSEILPSQERISGKHIANYSKTLKEKDSKKHSLQFSAYIKNNADPEKLPEKFSETKNKIIEEYGHTEESSENDSSDDEWEDADGDNND